MYVCSGEVRCGCLLRPATALGLAWPVTVLAVLSPRHGLQKAGESASVRGWLSVVSEVCPRGNAVLLPMILCALHGFCLYVMYVCFLTFFLEYECVCVQCDGAAELHLDWDADMWTDSWREPDLSAVLIPYDDVCVAHSMSCMRSFQIHTAGNRLSVPMYVCVFVCMCAGAAEWPSRDGLCSRAHRPDCRIEVRWGGLGLHFISSSHL